ncbi:MAG: uroporphyrinogen-III synthase [Pseudomonadota bacterium]
MVKESNFLTVEEKIVKITRKIIWSPMNLPKAKESSPLEKKRIVITRPKNQATDFIKMLKAQGAEPILFPTIQIVPPRDWSELDEAIAKLELYDTVIFTSVNGVNFFFQRLKKKGRDYHSLHNIRIGAIGPRTAEQIERFHLPVDIIPNEFRAESMVDALEKDGISGRRFLLPRAEKAREVLPEEIKQRGGYIDVVTAYRTSKGEGNVQEIKVLFQKRLIDVVTFTSSSTVKNFVDLLSGGTLPDLIKGCVVASIGPVTAKTAASLGIKTDIMPEEYTIQGLTEAMVDYFKSSQGG